MQDGTEESGMIGTQGSEGRVLCFISHSSTDGGQARELRRVLTEGGYEAWIAPDDITGSGPWAEQIVAAITGCSVMVVLLSRAANESRHVAREVHLALEHGKPVLPIRMEGGVTTGSLQYLLALHQIMDARGHDLRHLRDGLFGRIEGLLSSPGDVAAEGPQERSRRRGDNLPDQRTSFVGRTDEREALASSFEAHRLVTITGIGGGGKTRLATCVASDLLEEFPDGAWFVDLGPALDRESAGIAIAGAAGFRVPPERTPVGWLVDQLSDAETLIVLDNCEHIIEEAAAIVDELLAGTQNLKVLATSREALRVEGERVFPIPQLPVPATDSPDTIASSPAVRLFEDRARQLVPDLVLGDGDLKAVADICRQLDGWPLAIELAATRVTVISPQEIKERLAEVMRSSQGPRSKVARHQSLEAAIDWSYRLLDAEERLLFERLSVFPASFDLAAVESVAAAPDLEDGLDLLSRLVAKSLVSVDGLSSTGRRYRLLDPLRHYATGRLDERGETDAVWARHASHFVELAERAEGYLRSEKHAEWMDRLRAEYENLSAALRHSIDSGASETAARLAAALRRYWEDREDVREAGRWLNDVLAISETVSEPARAKLLLAVGNHASRIGEADRARSLLSEAVRLYRDLDGTGLVTSDDLSTALNNLAVLHAIEKEWDDAYHLWEEALVASRRDQNAWGTAVLLGNLALVAAEQDDIERARSLARQGVAASQQMGVGRRLADAYHVLGAIELSHGSPANAIEAFEHAAEQLVATSGPRHQLSYFRAQSGMAHLEAGDIERACEVFIPNAALALEEPDMSHPAELALGRMGIDLALGERVRAAVLLGVVKAMVERGVLLERVKALERYKQVLAESLDPAALEEAVASGESMSEDEAVAYIVAPCDSG
jgi:predicted ATPase